MRTVLATLGLGFLGAALTGGASAAATPLIAGLAGGLAGGAGGVAGNLATDLFKRLDRSACERFLDGWSGIDENHHVVAALRLAQIDAIRALMAQFEKSLGKNDDRRGDQLGWEFAGQVRKFLSCESEIARARTFLGEAGEAEIRRSVIALLPATFDNALAARRHPPDEDGAGSPVARVRAVTETAVFEELRSRCGDSARQIPHAFELLFLGGDNAAGWFDLFVRDGAEKLTHPDSEFAAIWNAEQTALIKAFAEATSATSRAALESVELLRQRFDAGLVLLSNIQIQLGQVQAAVEQTHDLLTEVHADRRDAGEREQQLIAEIASLRQMLERHLRLPARRNEITSELKRQAAELISQGKYGDAEMILKSAVALVRNSELVPATMAIADIHIDRARAFVLQRNVRSSLDAFMDARATVSFSGQFSWRCIILAFVAISFDQGFEYVETSGSRSIIFDDATNQTLYDQLLELSAERLGEACSDKLEAAVRSYRTGESIRVWSIHAEDAGRSLMAIAERLDSRLLAQVALLGFEYMSESFWTTDDPIDIEANHALILKARDFLNRNGRKDL